MEVGYWIGDRSSIFVVILSCLFVTLSAKALMGWISRGNFPPGPKGYPLIGNLLDLARLVEETRFQYRAWNQLAKMYGPIVGLKLGMAGPMMIISGKEAVTEMLNRSEFDGRSNDFFFRHRTMGIRRGVIFTDGITWKEQRRFLVRTLRDFGFGRKSMDGMILREALTLTRIVAEKSKEGPVDNVNGISTIAVLNSLWFLIVGRRFDQEANDSDLEEILRIINDTFHESNVYGALNQFPFLRHLFPGLTGYNVLNSRQVRIWNYFANVVSRHKNSEKRLQMDQASDLIEAHLWKIENQRGNEHSSFNEEQLVALVKDLFTAGVETTNNSIGFVLLYMVVYPEVQEKIQEEIDRVLGKDPPDFDEVKSRMPYLNAAITEVSRIANVTATTLPHRALVDTKFLGYDIRKDDMLLGNLYSVHMDEQHWGDPEVFRPERFIDENGLFVNDPWIISFGAGRRKCLGETVAKKSVFLVVCCLLQKLTFRLPPEDQVPSLAGVNGITVSPPNFRAIVSLR